MPALTIPPKFAAIFGIWTSIILAIGAGTIVLPLGIPPDWIDYIKSECIFWGVINSMILTACHAWSAPAAGPMVNQPPVNK